jgi:hypothetical protein
MSFASRALTPTCSTRNCPFATDRYGLIRPLRMANRTRLAILSISSLFMIRLR